MAVTQPTGPVPASRRGERIRRADGGAAPRSTGCCSTRAWSRWSAQAASARPASCCAPPTRRRTGTRTASAWSSCPPCATPSCCRTRSRAASGWPSRPAARSATRCSPTCSDRRLLLILDTCEHLIDAVAELVEAILGAAPYVTVLTSSREPLDVDGETTFPIRPLPVTRPEGTGEEPHPFGVTDFQRAAADGSGAETATAGDAVELFARRAAAAVPGFAVTDANRDDVIRLCQRLDGIPLAIELAAVRLRTLSLAELAARLDRRLPLLTGGEEVSNANDDRHRTLRDAIGWSYELCTDAERALWARLSVFAGAFNVAAAREVCASAGLDDEDIFETIIRLVDKSVLVRVEPTTAGGDGDQPAWYRMLDTIHEFGERDAPRVGRAGRRPRAVRRPLPGQGTVLRRAPDGRGPARAVPRAAPRAQQPPGRAPVHAGRRACGVGPPGRGARRSRCTATGTCPACCARAGTGSPRCSTGSPGRRGNAAGRWPAAATSARCRARPPRRWPTPPRAPRSASSSATSCSSAAATTT